MSNPLAGFPLFLPPEEALSIVVVIVLLTVWWLMGSTWNDRG